MAVGKRMIIYLDGRDQSRKTAFSAPYGTKYDHHIMVHPDRYLWKYIGDYKIPVFEDYKNWELVPERD